MTTKITTSTNSRRAEALRSWRDRHNNGSSLVLVGSLRKARRLLRTCPALARRITAIIALAA